MRDYYVIRFEEELKRKERTRRIQEIIFPVVCWPLAIIGFMLPGTTFLGIFVPISAAGYFLISALVLAIIGGISLNEMDDEISKLKNN